MKEFVDYDYVALVERATELLKNKEGWGDGYDSSQGQTLIQLVADTTDALHYMLERRTAENYFRTAKLRTTIISKASDCGYRFTRIKGNTGYLTITLKNSSGSTIPAVAPLTIPKFTPISYDDRNFLTIESVVVEQGTSSVDVLVKEGILETTTHTIGTNNEIKIQDYSTIDDSGLFVSTSQGEFLDVVTQNNVNKRALLFLRFSDKFYDIKYTVDGMEILFGDGRFGALPSGTVTLRTIHTEVTDSILSLDQTFEFSDSVSNEDFPDDVGNVYSFEIKNSTAISGAKIEETLEEISKNAPIYTRTNGRANGHDDYTYWVLKSGIGAIKDVRAYGEEELKQFFYLMNNVFITYLTEDGEKLSTADHGALLAYLKNVKVAVPHIVLKQADILDIRVTLDVRKNPLLTISNSEFYSIIYKFLVDWFALTSGSIGRTVHSSDVINDMYALRYLNGGINKPVIDFAKLQLDGRYDFTYPPKSSSAFVTLDTEYEPADGEEFVLILENLVCSVDVSSADTKTEILLRMRDKIMEVTPFIAKVDLTGSALDAFGNPIPLEFSPSVGDNLLIGVDTPYFSNDQLLGNLTIGSTTAEVIRISPEIEINHYYYSSPTGRRPMIPLRIGTEITFTAPTDSDVVVYFRSDMHDEETEIEVETITAGAEYTFTSTEDEHSIQFEYESDSTEDVTANIIYPSTVGTKFGLQINSLEGVGLFNIQTTSGDISDSVLVDYSLKVPTAPKSSLSTTLINTILPGSVTVRDASTTLRVFGDNGNGLFTDTSGAVVANGRIDYSTGELYLPETTPTTNLYVRYKQDIYDNYTVDNGTAIRLIAPKPSLNSSIASTSTIRIV